MVEQWVEGVEMAVSVLGTGWDAYALPPVEIVAKSGRYDTEARMTPGAVEYFAPVRPASLAQDEADAQAIRAEIERAALEVYPVPTRCATLLASTSSGTVPKRAHSR